MQLTRVIPSWCCTFFKQEFICNHKVAESVVNLLCKQRCDLCRCITCDVLDAFNCFNKLDFNRPALLMLQYTASVVTDMVSGINTDIECENRIFFQTVSSMDVFKLPSVMEFSEWNGRKEEKMASETG